MESRTYLLLLCTFSLALTSGAVATNDEDIDLVSFLRGIYSGLLVRDTPFVINRGLEINSLKKLRHPEVTEQAKDKPVSQDANGPAGPVVLTKDGQIKGITVDKAHIFYGIPYAGPPTGAYRWKPPRPVTPWSGVYDASFPRSACMQVCTGPITAECPQKVRNNAFLLLLLLGKSSQNNWE